MFILIRKNYQSVKSTIKDLIDKGVLENWSFIVEEERLRLVFTGDKHEYEDVVLRFLTSYDDGEECLKIRPSVRVGDYEQKRSEGHFGVVISRFSELLNSFFQGIGSYEIRF